ncbi:MAG: VOC family protein [Acidobacteria bacterium]|nr:VOC family protein [Acidobacteriota bacterium]
MSSKVNYRPEGYPTLSPYLIVNDGAAALEFYAAAFGATVNEKMMTPEGRVMHAELNIGDSPVMLGERQDVAAQATPTYAPVSLYAYVEDADAVFAQALAAGAKEVAPVELKFYGNREGGVTDPFGITWWLATRVGELTAEEMQQHLTQQLS